MKGCEQIWDVRKTGGKWGGGEKREIVVGKRIIDNSERWKVSKRQRKKNDKHNIEEIKKRNLFSNHHNLT